MQELKKKNGPLEVAGGKCAKKKKGRICLVHTKNHNYTTNDESFSNSMYDTIHTKTITYMGNKIIGITQSNFKIHLNLPA